MNLSNRFLFSGIFILLLISALGCKSGNGETISSDTVSDGSEIDLIKLVKKDGLIYYNGEIFSGVGVRYNDSKDAVIVSATYSKGLLHGPYKEFFKEGKKKVKSLFNYSKGELNGVHEEYEIKIKKQAVKNKNKKKQIVIGPNKVLRENYVDGQLHGLKETWYFSETKQSEEHYQKGIRQGKYYEWFSTGKPKVESTYKNDALEGSYKEWHLSKWNEDEKLAKIMAYENGLIQGATSTWKKNGFLESELNYINGKQEGAQIEYFGIDKRIRIAYTSKDGLKDGDFISYFRRTQTVKEKGQFALDKREGTWEVFDIDGNKIDSPSYRSGERIN